MNAMTIHAVKLYKLYGTQWVFDDPAKEIWAEAFVGGTDVLIDRVIEKQFGSVNKEREYVLRFSKEDFPNAKHLEFQPVGGLKAEGYEGEIVDSGSYWVSYDFDEYHSIIWLCDTLNEYFDHNTKLLFFEITL